MEMLPAAGKVNKITRLEITGKDNRAVTEFELFIRNTAEEDWKPLATVPAENNKAVYEWDTTLQEEDTYYVKAVARDGHGNENTDLFMRRYVVDNTGIAKIRLLDATVGSTGVLLAWEDVTEEDFGWFLVEELVDGNWVEKGKVSDTLGFKIENLMPANTYTYRVTGADVLGNMGVPSDVLTITTKEDTTPPVITAVNPISSYYNGNILLSMSVKDNGGVAWGKFSYRYGSDLQTKEAAALENINEKENGGVSANDIEKERTYALESGGWREIATVSANGLLTETLTCNWDLSELPEGEVTVRFEAYDTAGYHNTLFDDKEIENTYIIDKSAPEKVQGAAVTGEDGYIGLTWENVSDKDVASYEIQRALEDEGIFERVGVTNNTLYYHDGNVKQGVTYVYRILAIDIAGNRGEASDEICGTVKPDKEAPVVTGISPGETVIGANPTLKILATDNAALKSVQVEFREEGEGIWHEIATLSAQGRVKYEAFTWDTAGLSEGVTYEVRAKAVDEAGNEGDYTQKTYTLDLTPPKAPELSVESGSFCVKMEFTENEEEDFRCYKIYRREYGDQEYTCIQATIQTEFTDVPPKTDTTYYYKVRAYDIYDNYSESEAKTCYANHVDTIAPVAELPETLFGFTGMEVAFDGTLCSDNVRINRYEWDFGDGAKASGSRPVHTYEKSGIYSVTLTVLDAAGNEAFTTSAVQIMDKENNGVSILHILAEDGNAVGGAYVYIKTGNGTEDVLQLRSDKNGEVKVIGKSGIYEYAAFAPGYMPSEGTVRISNYETVEESVTLKKGEVVTGNLTVERMELDELIEKGVDLSAPENYHTFRFKTELWFASSPLPLVMDITENMDGIRKTSNVNTGKSIGTFTQNESTIEVILLNPSKEIPYMPSVYRPGITYLQTTQSVSWMKDMYDVQLGIINNADSGYPLTDASATLNLPEGLSLASVKSGQTLTTVFGNIEGQESTSASWVVRGDKTGIYRFSASFHGVLQPFDADMDVQFEAEADCVVPGGSGIHIYVCPENAYYPGEDYYIQFEIVNESSRDFYNLKTSLGEYIQSTHLEIVVVKDINTGLIVGGRRSGGKVYRSASAAKSQQVPVLYDGDIIDVGVFSPGEKIYATYCKRMGQAPSDSIYYILIDSLVSAIEGENLGVEVSVKVINSHISKYVVVGGMLMGDEGDFDELMLDPVDMTTGAFLQELNTISLNGGNAVSFDLYYNSMLAEYRGEAGYGWSHDYEQWIEDHGNTIALHLSPYREANFINEEAAGNISYGTVKDDTILLDGQTAYTGIYHPVGGGMEGWKIEKNGQGYIVTAANKSLYTFDEDGRLTRLEDTDGRAVRITYQDNFMKIVDEITKEYLLVSYDEDGFIQTVSDHTDRTVTLTHNGGNLTSITGLTGNTSVYAYDAFHHMINATNSEGITYVRNTYDEEGRISTQEETGKAGVTRMSYEDTEEGGVRIKITDVTGADMFVYTNAKGDKIKTVDVNGATTEYLYDSKGNLLDEIDSYGNTVMYQYDEKNRLIRTYDTAGNITFIDYDDSGNPTKIYDRNEKGTTFSYDEKGRLIRKIGALGDVTRFVYDEQGNLISQSTDGKGALQYKYESGRLISQIDENGNEILFTYDSYGNICKKTDAMGNVYLYNYNQAGQLIDEMTADGVKKTYIYDSAGQIIKVVWTASDSSSKTERYEYDGAGRLTGIIDAAGNSTLYCYDEYGNKTLIIYPDGTRETFAYDAGRNLIKKITAGGNVTEYAYDLNHNMLTETNGDVTVGYEYYPNGKLYKQILPDDRIYTYTYDSSWNCILITDSAGGSMGYTYDEEGNMTSVRDALGNTTRYMYDSFGRCIRVTDPNGNYTSYLYDNHGNCIRQIDGMGTVIHMTYDSLNRPVSTWIQTESGKISTDYVYDSMGRVVAVTDGEGVTNHIVYDSFGNQISITDGEGNVLQENTYDVLGQLTETRDILGNKTSYSYDMAGNLTRVVECLNGANQNETVYSYDMDAHLTAVKDKAGNITSQIYDTRGNVISVTDAMGGTTSYSYDSMNRVTEIVNAIGAKESYCYNASGLLSESRNANNEKTSYEYDRAGRIIEQKDKEGTISYTYDANGNVLTVSDNKGTISRTYDALDRVTSVTDYKGDVIRYGYDQLGNRTYIIYPGGEKVRYTYDKTGRLLTVTDAQGAVTYYTYDKNGRLIETCRGDGSIENCAYDKTGRLESITDKTSVGAVINHYTYEYDERGNIAKITGMDSGISAVSQGKQTNDEKEILNLSAVMTYDADNRLLTYNGQTVEYDACGNMIKGPLNGEMAEFTYDCRNRLIKVTEETGRVTFYEYDAENIRTASVTNGIRTEYTTDRESTYSQTLVKSEYERNAFGFYIELINSTTYIYGLGLISERRDTKEIYYYHYNHLGSTMAISDADGNVVYRFAYGTYGELSDIKDGNGASLGNIAASEGFTYAELADAIGIQYLYNGQYGVETDRDGLYYMRARYYDQDIKRFINRDVLRGDIGNSQSLNRFCYVQGNPVSLTDPFGLCPDSNVAFKKLCIGAYHLDWNALGHTALDIAGFFFQPADVVNAIWYAKEGNMKMAAASAMAVFCDATAGSKLLLGGSKFGKYQGVVNTVAHLVFGGVGVAIGSDMFMTNYENFVGGLKDGRFDVESLGNMVLGGLIAGYSAKGLWNGIGMAAASGSVKGSAKGNVVPLADWDDLNDITMRQFIQLSGSNGRSPSEWARSWQGTEPYLGVDTYRDITLRRGKIIYRGEPNGTEYFTTRSAIERSERDRVKIFQGLQVLEHETYGYRGNMMGYMVMNDIDAAFGITRANTDYGKGGLPQIFVPNAKWLIDSGILVPVYNIQLK